MSSADYFQIYTQIVAQALRKIKKSGIKKYAQIRELVQTAENYLSKEVYGRIEPANYLLVLVVVLGTRASKIYPPIINAVQRLFAYNFISPSQDLSSSTHLLRDQHRELLLLPPQHYGQRTFKQVYIQTLIGLGVGDKQQGLAVSVAKSISLVWRLDQNSIPLGLVGKIFDYLLQCMVNNRGQDQQKMFKSIILQMFRHSLESYREVYDRRFLHHENKVSLKGICSKYTHHLADLVSIRMDLHQRTGKQNYSVVPTGNPQTPFQFMPSKALSQKGLAAGKFGWCTNCRQPANYYCMQQRLPVCCYQCKQTINSQLQNYQKFQAEQQRSSQVFESHIVQLFSIFAKYLSHSQPRKRFVFSEVFVQMTSQIKKIVERLTPKAYKQLRGVVRQLIVNVYAQTEAYLPCMVTLKKMINLRIFLDQTQSALKLFAKKITFFLTQPALRDQIIKFVKDLLQSRLLFDAAIELDCSADHLDAVRDMVDALSQVYLGIPVPQTIASPPAEDIVSRRRAIQFFTLLLKQLKSTRHRMSRQEADVVMEQKRRLNRLKQIMTRFNQSQKPLKQTKKLIKEKLFPSTPIQISKFLHDNLKKLNPTNIGQLIGDIDQFAGQIRRCFIDDINFVGLPVDEGMRVLLKHFTLPGESQVVQRIVQTFGITYFGQNSQDRIFNHSDGVYSFSYLLMMLQSNLHNPQVIQKMTLPQFANLSKNMNGPNTQFPMSFLQAIYNSVQKTPLGVHQKLKEIQIIIAYNVNPKKAQDLYLRDLQKQAHEMLDQIEQGPILHLPQRHHYPLAVFVDEFTKQAVDTLAWRIRQLQDKDKQQLVRVMEQLDKAMKLGVQWQVSAVVQRAVEKMWQQIQKATISKKYLLMQNLFESARKYGQHLKDQWSVIVYLISKFVRNKTLRKDPHAAKNHLSITVIQNKCFLFESYVQQLFSRASKWQMPNLIGFLKALLQISRDQVKDAGNSFCLEKISQVIQMNGGRSVEIMAQFWGQLAKYYVELGQHKIQKVALFSSDFLKQLVTKFLKRKDLLHVQRQYLKPFQQIFVQSKNFAVRELTIGSLSYFVNNHHPSLQSGWKTILSVVSACFQEQENDIIKEKAYAIIKKINDSSFGLFLLEEHRAEVVQVLAKLPKQKEEQYALGCLQSIQLIIEYQHKKLGIDLSLASNDPANAKADINFWQTVFLPLLNIIFPMCGDSRTKVQQPAIDCLFAILTKYGKLFNYQFWKMVLQGVLRPAFQQITYTSQSRPLKRKQLQQWLKSSFTRLFTSINGLIVLFYDDFRLFLEDVFKIYQNCILNHSLKLLITLSLDALNQLLEKIAPNFQEEDWKTYLLFAQSLLKKTLPVEISSEEAWSRSKDLLQNNYESKCYALFVFLNRAQDIYQKYPQKISQQIYKDTLAQLEPILTFVNDFNDNISLRTALWSNGFYPDIKILPGLIKHHYQLMRFRSRIYFKLIHFDHQYTKDYLSLAQLLFQKTLSTRLTEFIKEPTVNDLQRQRMGANYRLLLTQTVLPQLKQLGGSILFQAGVQKLFLNMGLDLIGRRYYCTRCTFCEQCENSAEGAQLLNNALKELVIMLFEAK